MRKIYLTTAIFAAAIMTLFASCSNSVAETVETTAESTTAESSVETTAATTENSEDEIIPLKSATVTQLENAFVTAEMPDGSVLDINLYGENVSVISGTELSWDPDTYAFFRKSSALISVDGYDEYSIMPSVEQQDYFSSYNNSYAGQNFNFLAPIIKLNGYSNNNNDIKIEDITFEYSFWLGNEVNAFVRKNPNGTGCEIIIDPAFMFNLPVFSSKIEDMTFDINGIKIEADTLKFSADINEEVDFTFENDDYFYAKVDLGVIDCKYATNSGYSSIATVYNIEKITDDVETVLKAPYSILSKSEKDTQIAETYNAIMKNIDTIIKATTVGINFLDLDFDGTPELLVSNTSKALKLLYTEGDNSAIDVDIFDINNGELKYIDTLYNYSQIIYDNGNILSLKTLGDGSRAWFAASYKNRETGEISYDDTDYLFTLENGKLNFTEIFRLDNERKEGIQAKFYIFGKEVVPNETIKYSEYYGGDYTELDWNGLKASNGINELAGYIKNDYCSDMKESSYSLFSSWLIGTSDCNYLNGNDIKKPILNQRQLSAYIACYLNSSFFGENNIIKDNYGFNFDVSQGYGKPVIYLYPEEETDVSVKVDFDGEFTCTYPEYGNGWNVTAEPDGTLYDADGNEYYCLYWEGEGVDRLDESKGFCVTGKDTAAFLREKLMYIGLSAREANEFIIYWLPQMEDNAYNIITLHTEDYSNTVNLDVSPQPDSVIRVFMTFTASDEAVKVTEQTLPQYERNGFTVVEWGGREEK